MRLAAAVACAMLAFVVMAANPAAAGASTRQALSASPSTLTLPPSGHFPDRLLTGSAPRMQRLARTSAPTEYPVLGGYTVEAASSGYEPSQVQRVIDTLGGLVHGAEMDTLSVYVATPDEIASLCGPVALACYAPALRMMIVSGEEGSAYGVPREYVIAHEYGHHVAAASDNAPWSALDSGAKRWATYERVCKGVRQGLLHPGDEGDHYWENPGEAFAEANARLNFPDVAVPWGFSPLLRPDGESTARLATDITAPWRGPALLTWHGAVPHRRVTPAVRRFSTPLDGRLSVQLEGPPGADYDLYLLSAKSRRVTSHAAHRPKPRPRVLARAASSGSSEHLELNVCGRAAVRVEVRRRSGSGPFTLALSRP